MRLIDCRKLGSALWLVVAVVVGLTLLLAATTALASPAQRGPRLFDQRWLIHFPVYFTMSCNKSSVEFAKCQKGIKIFWKSMKLINQ